MKVATLYAVALANLIILASLAAACDEPEPGPRAEMTTSEANGIEGAEQEGARDEAEPTEKKAGVYETTGVVKAIADDKKSVTIHHDDVPGYMPAMTMPFFVRQPSALDGIQADAKVRFSFEKGEDGKHFIVSIATI